MSLERKRLSPLRVLVICGGAGKEAQVGDSLEPLLPRGGRMVEQSLPGLRSRGSRYRLQMQLFRRETCGHKTMLLRGSESLSTRAFRDVVRFLDRQCYSVDWLIMTYRSHSAPVPPRLAIGALLSSLRPDLIVSLTGSQG